MLSAYDRRLVLFYLSNAASHLRYHAEAAKNLKQWLMDHEEGLKFRCPQTPNSVTKEVPSLEWQRLAEALRSEFAAARQARPGRHGDPGTDAELQYGVPRQVDGRRHFFLKHYLLELQGGELDSSVSAWAIARRGPWTVRARRSSFDIGARVHRRR